MAGRTKLLHKASFFAGVSAPDAKRIAECARSQSFTRNERLFMQGQPLQRVTIIESGCVKLTHLSFNGSEVILALRGTSQVLTLPSFSSRGYQTFTADAMNEGKILSWSCSNMDSLMATVPQLKGNICRILAGQLAELQERYCELSVERVEGRLASTLVRLARQIGNPTRGGFEVPISRQELAQMVGTTMFTVSRLISKWGKMGLVEPLREAVLVLMPEGLELLSSLDHQPSGAGAGLAKESNGSWN
ncbi:MAG TPA: Crp/Fnr family transcriptional regulator [Acidobacteriaceae bacterium]